MDYLPIMVLAAIIDSRRSSSACFSLTALRVPHAPPVLNHAGLTIAALSAPSLRVPLIPSLAHCNCRASTAAAADVSSLPCRLDGEKGAEKRVCVAAARLHSPACRQILSCRFVVWVFLVIITGFTSGFLGVCIAEWEAQRRLICDVSGQLVALYAQLYNVCVCVCSCCTL